MCGKLENSRELSRTTAWRVPVGNEGKGAGPIAFPAGTLSAMEAPGGLRAGPDLTHRLGRHRDYGLDSQMSDRADATPPSGLNSTHPV